MSSASIISAIRICDWFISPLARSLRTNRQTQEICNGRNTRTRCIALPSLERSKDPNTWSELAQREWADPVAAAASHRVAMRTGISRVRQALDDFDPDFVLIWGDDQYENFKEDIVPAFSVLAYEDMTIKPCEQASAATARSPMDWTSSKRSAWRGSSKTCRASNSPCSPAGRQSRRRVLRRSKPVAARPGPGKLPSARGIT
jgi:hypothetical protein